MSVAKFLLFTKSDVRVNSAFCYLTQSHKLQDKFASKSKFVLELADIQKFAWVMPDFPEGSQIDQINARK